MLVRVAALGVVLVVCRSLVLPQGKAEASSRDRQREDEWAEETGGGLKVIAGNPAAQAALLFSVCFASCLQTGPHM